MIHNFTSSLNTPFNDDDDDGNDDDDDDDGNDDNDDNDDDDKEIDWKEGDCALGRISSDNL